MPRHRSSPSRPKDQPVSPLWENVLRTMRTWMDAQDAHQATNGEDDHVLEQVFENEWSAVQAVNLWLSHAKNVGMRTSDLNEDEGDALDYLVMTSQTVHHDPQGNEDLPFMAVLFMPIAVWNDDQTAPSNTFQPWSKGSLLLDLAARLRPVLERRLEEAWLKPTKNEEFEVECLPAWNLERVRHALETGLTHMHRPHAMTDQEHLALQDSVDGEWLRAGVMPVLVRSTSYEAIAGLDFNADRSFEEATADIRSERWSFAPPLPFMEAVEEAERSRWDLWAQTLVEGPLSPNAQLRTTEFAVQLREHTMESVSATVRDLAADGSTLQTWHAQRKLDGPDDWARVVHIWTMTASLAFRWSVHYEKAAPVVINPTFDGIRHARDLQPPAGTMLH